MSKPVQIAYLEISGRQTGKSHRLAEQGKAVVAQGKHAILVCSPSLAPYFRRLFPWMVVVSDSQRLPVGVNPDTAVWFYDEFDWLKSVAVRPGAYYSSTARYLRVAGEPAAEDDVLMQLLEANGNKCETHLTTINHDAMRYWRLEMSPEQFRLNALGAFLS